MKDIAHETTDKLLDKTEKAMQEIYNKVYADLKKELTNAANKIEALPSDATIQQRINAWNKYDRLNNLETQIAEQLATANKDAMKLSNQMHNKTYKDNYDYTAYLIETGSDNIGTIPILDKSAINEYIEKGYSPFTRIALDDLQDKKVIYRAIAREMASGIALGEGNNKLATRLRKVVNKDYSSAVRIARTETTRIEGNARQQVYDTAKQKGIKTKKEWVATLDGDTRRDHRKLDGQIVDIDDYFKVGSAKAKYPGDFGRPEEDINCFIGTTKAFTDTPIKASFKRWYDGELYTIKTASGIEFSCSPNHPILTDKGWVGARFLNKGDNLIKGTLGNNEISRINPHVNDIQPTMAQIHNSSRSMGKRVSVVGVDFHGDISNSNVEIVFIKRFLPNCIKSFRFNVVNKFNFKSSRFKRFVLSGDGSFNKFFFRSFITSYGIMTGFSKLFSFFGRGFRHSKKHGFASISNSNVKFFKNSIYDVSTNSEMFSSCLNGFRGQIEFDNVIDINVTIFSGHIYNLHTENNIYLVNNSISKNKDNCNGIVVHNCRCTTRPVLDGYTSKRMTYDEWEKERNSNVKNKT